MTWTRWAASALVVGTLATAAMMSCTTNSQTPAASTATAEDKLVRGKRLAYTSGCVDCHTPGSLYGAPDTTRMLSGSELGWVGPWGVTYPRNLTPDSTTGLGSWSEDQIVTAIREGRRPDGSPLLPPMPWTMFAHFTDDEVYAIAAYLKSVPAVAHEMPKQLPPGTAPPGPALVFPGPPAWDAQNLPPPPAAGAPPAGH